MNELLVYVVPLEQYSTVIVTFWGLEHFLVKSSKIDARFVPLRYICKVLSANSHMNQFITNPKPTMKKSPQSFKTREITEQARWVETMISMDDPGVRRMCSAIKS